MRSNQKKTKLVYNKRSGRFSTQLAECDRCFRDSLWVLLHHQSCFIPLCTMCLNRWLIKADVYARGHWTCWWYHKVGNNLISQRPHQHFSNHYLSQSQSSPDLLPSFSFSSCPSSRNSQRRARWRHKGGCPAPPTPPAAHVMSRQPGDTTSSWGCKHSSPPSGKEEGGEGNVLKKRWIEWMNLKSCPPKKYSKCNEVRVW